MDTEMPGAGVCWKLVRRRVADEMVELLLFYADMVNTRGYAMSWGRCFSSRNAYHCATARLRKQGMIARRADRRGPAQLIALEGARERLSDFYRAERFWSRKWNGVWQVLMYDVPETERCYRDALRTFLKRHRMGGLQRSVWVSTEDLRAEYHDLCEASQVDAYSFLMQARTLMGASNRELAAGAWDLARLRQGHRWYLDTYRNRMLAVQRGELPPESILHTVREELAAFETVTKDDPLLPRELYPEDYLGPDVLAFHGEFMRNVGAAAIRQWSALKATHTRHKPRRKRKHQQQAQ
ncbi:MAG: hypothetical protein ISS31_09225 [Kiritimatiellae bacterium]|nr:hypothetical protein [Kiritimatiellia bacterium]